jgi:uncharacterized membrane protein YkvA (DUF1232 family)
VDRSGSLFLRAKRWAGGLRRDAVALWLAARDPRVPWYAKAVAALAAAYALSPIDLIPDFIPVVGYLDDLVIVPASIMLAVWLVPDDLMRELREEAAGRHVRPRGIAGVVLVGLVWIGALGAVVWWWRA